MARSAQLDRLAQKISSLQSIEAQREEFVALVHDVLNASHLGLYVYDAIHGKLTLSVSVGLQIREQRLSERTAMQRQPGQVVQSLQPIYVPAAPSVHGVNSLFRMFLPILSGKSCLGVLAVSSKDEISVEQQDTLFWLAQQLVHFLQPRSAYPTVLVADDNKVSQVLAERLLEKQGCHVVSVENGLLAVQAVQAQNFDLILLDLQMPELNGYEALQQIRLEPKFQKTPIIALTAAEEVEERTRCLACGFDEQLCKPLRVQDITMILSRFLHKQAEATPKRSETNLHRELLRVVQEHWPLQRATFEDALQCNVLTGIARAAHSLRGLIGFWAQEKLMQQLLMIERDANNNVTPTEESKREIALLLDKFTTTLSEKSAELLLA